MLQRTAFFLVLLALGSAAFLSLLGGAGFLEPTLPGGLPYGNVAASLGLCALAGAACVASRRGSRSRSAATLALLGAIAWLPVSAVLAGNLGLNFDGWPGTAFMAWSALVLGAVLGTLCWALLAAFIAACRHLMRA
jgi:hypothetical protein